MIKWLYRLAWFCVVLGIAGSIAIVVWVVRNNNNESDTIDETPINLPISGDSVLQPNKADETRRKAAMSINGDEENAESRETKIPANDNTRSEKKQTPDRPITDNRIEQASKLLTQDEQEKLLLDLQDALVEFDVNTNCIKIYRTDNESNNLIFLQIELLLKSHNFTIAGRETISAKRKGIQIGFSNECLKLTVGSF